MNFTSKDFPELYDAANSASMNAQRNHLMIIRAYLSLLIIGSIITAYYEEIDNASIYAIIVFLATLFLTILQAFKRYDRIWYNGRAVAESIKTRAWRYVMNCEPYNSGNVDVDSALFRSELKAILRENKDLGAHLSPEMGLNDAVTDSMNYIRALSLQERMKLYADDRIDDQRKWYASKGGYNKRMGNIWFVFLVAIHLIIIVFLLVKIKQPKLLLPADTLIVIAGCIVTWVQVKKFQDLSTAYTLTAREIGIIKGDSSKIHSEKEFSDFVKDAENAFSREHTQWAARKDS